MLPCSSIVIRRFWLLADIDSENQFSVILSFLGSGIPLNHDSDYTTKGLLIVLDIYNKS
jgi:hypothetical protein